MTSKKCSRLGSDFAHSFAGQRRVARKIVHNILTTFLFLSVFTARASECEKAARSLAITKLKPTPVAHSPLQTLDENKTPWTYLDGEQPFLYIGNSPREMALGLPFREKPVLPSRLKGLAERELERIKKKLDLETAQFEIWPVFDDWGATTWAVARYRESSRHPWQWLEQKFANSRHDGHAGSTTGI